MSINHFSEFLVRLQALPLQAGAPVLEEASGPALALVVPKLTKGLFEKVCRVQSLVGRQQGLQRTLAIHVEILPMRQQRVLLAFDESALVPGEARVLGLAHRIERLAQVGHDVELVKQDGRLRRIRAGRIAEGLPHIHHGQANLRALLLAKPRIEHRHARLGAVTATEPDRTTANQIADHDAIGVTFADRDLVDADGFGAGCTRFRKLRTHVLHLQRLDRIPVKLQLQSDVLDRPLSAAPTHVVRKPFGIEGVVGQEIELLAFHLVANPTMHASHFDLQVDTGVATGQVANASSAPVVPARVDSTTTAADRFFERRTSVMTRAFGSPKTPRTVGCGRKSASAYASDSRLFRLTEFAIQT